MAATQSPILAPRDLASLSMLKSHGLQLVEVRISSLSPALGRRVESLHLPHPTRVLCIIRNGKTLIDLDPVFLMEEDYVYLLTDQELLIRQVFSVGY